MFSLLEALIKILCFTLGFYGLWKLIGTPFLQAPLESTVSKWKRQRKLKRLQELNSLKKEEVKERSKFYLHLEMMLNSLSKKNQGNVFNFITLTIIIFIVTTFFLYQLINDILLTTLIGFSFAALPYVISKFRLTALRMKTQMAFLNEYHNMVQSYHATGNDIYYTIQNVIKDTRDKDLKIIYTKLYSSLQKDRGNREFVKAVNQFSYTINSTFSKRFAKLLVKAHVDRADISLSLMDMNTDIKKRKQDMQSEKTNKLETILSGYLPLVLLPVMVFAAYKISNLHQFWYYFQQKTALTLFIIAFICTIASGMLAFISSKPKADI